MNTYPFNRVEYNCSTTYEFFAAKLLNNVVCSKYFARKNIKKV